MSDPVREAMTERMRGVYEREKRLRESAMRTIHHGEPIPKGANVRDITTGKWPYYVESETAGKLRKVFEDGVEPWW